MYSYMKNILIILFLITGSIYACNRGDNCFIPEADAGEDQTYYIGSTVTLDGSGSYDPEGSVLTYSWTSDYLSPDFETDFVADCQLQGGPSSLVENFCNSIYFNEDFDSNCEDNGLIQTVLDLCEQTIYSDWFNCDDLVDNVCEESSPNCDIPEYICSFTAQQIPTSDCQEFYDSIEEN